MFHSISLFVSLYLFWLLLSGFFTPFLLSAGVGSALAVVWFARRMDVVDHEGHPIRLGPKALVYWPWLLKEIVKSAWDVSKIILHPNSLEMLTSLFFGLSLFPIFTMPSCERIAM